MIYEGSKIYALFAVASLTHIACLSLFLYHMAGRIIIPKRHSKLLLASILVSFLAQASLSYSNFRSSVRYPYTIQNLVYLFSFIGFLTWVYCESEFLIILRTLLEEANLPFSSHKSVRILQTSIGCVFVVIIFPVVYELVVLLTIKDTLDDADLNQIIPAPIATARIILLGIGVLLCCLWEIFYSTLVFLAVSKYSERKILGKATVINLGHLKVLSISIALLDTFCAVVTVVHYISNDNSVVQFMYACISYIVQFHLLLIATIFFLIPRVILPKETARVIKSKRAAAFLKNSKSLLYPLLPLVDIIAVSPPSNAKLYRDPDAITTELLKMVEFP